MIRFGTRRQAWIKNPASPGPGLIGELSGSCTRYFTARLASGLLESADIVETACRPNECLRCHGVMTPSLISECLLLLR
jgi:hypothetical protein